MENIYLSLKFLENDDIKNILSENTFAKSFTVNWAKNNCVCTLYNLQEKFINLSELTIVIDDIFNEFKTTTLLIKENPNCQIKTFSLIVKSVYHPDIYCFCCLYEQLEKISFIFEGTMSQLNFEFPLFKEDSQVIFKSLTNFYFKNNFDGVKLSFLKNLYNNIESMPNLKDFYLDVILSECQIDNEFEIFYKEFIRKILSLKLKNIQLAVRKDRDDLNDEDIFDDEEYQDEKKDIRYYSRREIKGICPKADIDCMDKIQIRKLNIETVE